MTGPELPELDSVVGPVEWHHEIHYCNCFDDAPENPEAYMSSQCRTNYLRGIAQRKLRVKKLKEALILTRISTLEEAAEALPFIDRPDNILVRQQDAAHFLKDRANELRKDIQ
jgi:hypothetical protein